MVKVQTKNKYLNWVYWIAVVLMVLVFIQSIYQLVFSLQFFFPTGIVKVAGGGGTWLFENIIWGIFRVVFLDIASFVILLFIIKYFMTQNKKWLSIAKKLAVVAIFSITVVAA